MNESRPKKSRKSAPPPDGDVTQEPPREKAHKREEGPRLIQAAYFAMARDPRSPGMAPRQRRLLCCRAVDFVVDHAKAPTTLTKGRDPVQKAFKADLWRAAIDAVREAHAPPSPLINPANAVRTPEDSAQ